MTGYLQYALDTGADLRQLVMTYARSIDHCASMRDEPLTTPIPERFEVPAEFAERVAEAQAENDAWQALSYEERYAEAERRLAETARRCAEADTRDTEKVARVKEMLRQVEAWDAPASCANLKRHMMDDLKYEARMDTPSTGEPLDPGSYLWRIGDSLSTLLSNAVFGLRDAEKRVAEANAWLAELRASLPQEEGA